MSDAELDAIERRADAALAGPWHVERDGLVYSSRAAGAWSVGTNGGEATADFIAAARSDVPVLVAEVRRLRTEAAINVTAPACGCAVDLRAMERDTRFVNVCVSVGERCEKHREARL